MKHLTVIGLFLLISTDSPSYTTPLFKQVEGFEKCIPCDAMLYNCNHWQKSPYSYPYVYSICNDGIPYNQAGKQHPLEGDSYAAFQPLTDIRKTYDSRGNKFRFLIRDYLRLKLNSPLIKGKSYSVSFYLSLAESSSFYTDRISMDVSAMPLRQVNKWGSALIHNHKVKLNSISPLNDSINWVKTEATFLAGGGETHLTIGTFNGDISYNEYIQLLKKYPKIRTSGLCYYVDKVEIVEHP